MPVAVRIGILACALACASFACSGGTGSGGDVPPGGCADDAADPEACADATSTSDAASDSEDDAVIEDSAPPPAIDSGLFDTYTPPADTGCPNHVDGDERITKARKLGEITDCDGTGSSFSGTLADGTDVDWVYYSGNDNFGCSVDPWAKTTAPVELCMAAVCPILGIKSMSCTKGTKTTTDGTPSCCTGAGGGEVQMSLDCLDYRDDAQIYLGVRDLSGSCAVGAKPYTVQYHF